MRIISFESSETRESAKVPTKYIPEVTEYILHGTISTTSTPFEGSMTILIILSTLLFVTKNLIGLSCLFEFFFSLFVTRIFIRVVF